MALEIIEVTQPRQYKTFVKFAHELYKGNRFWVPGIIKDEIKTMQAEFNPAFAFCKVKFWIAYDNGKPVGRIGGIINQRYNEKTGEALARFTRPEFIENESVAHSLLETVEKWAKQEGMIGIHGPLGFSNLDTQGLLIDGFDYLPSVASVYHLPYYQRFIESKGYEKEIDWLEFRLTIKEIPENAKRLTELIKKRYSLSVKSFDNVKEALPYAPHFFNLINESFKDLPFVAPFDAGLAKYYTDKYFKVLNPKFIKVIENQEGKVCAFIIGVPSLSEAMQKAKGRLFPFGAYHILKALKKPTVADLFLTAVDPKMQHQGLAAILIDELQQTMLDHHVAFVETTGIFETNHKAIQHWKNYEHIQHKRRRCFRKMF